MYPKIESAQVEHAKAILAVNDPFIGGLDGDRARLDDAYSIEELEAVIVLMSAAGARA